MRTILKGATDQSVVIRIVDSSDGTPETGVTSASGGLDLKYRREGAATANLTESDLSALTDAHADGGLLHIGAGYYRVDVPDAAFATGANGVLVFGTVTGMVVIGCYVHLVDFNPQDAVRLGLTALPNAAADAAGGLIISDAGGLDADAQRADVAAILVDTGTTLQGELDGIQADTEDIQSRLPAALVNSRMDCTIDGTGMETGAVDSILNRDASGSTTNSTLGAIVNDWENGGRLDLIVDDILVDTAEIGAAGAGLTNINLPNQTMDIVGNITGNLSGSVGSVTGAVGSVTGNVGGNVTGSIGSLATQAKADVNTEVDGAIETYHLDHLLAAEYSASAKPGDPDALLNVLVESDDGSPTTPRFTATALEEAPTGGSAPTAGEIADAVWDEDATGHQTQGTFGQAIGDPTSDANTIYGAVVTGAAGATIAADIVDIEGKVDDLETELAKVPKSDSNVTWNATAAAQIQSEANDALVANHLDHLLAAEYDASSKPGDPDALLNVLVEPDDGSPTTPRYTATALEQAPTGGSAPTAAAIADAVWDEDATAHQTGGTFGQAIGDPGADTNTIFKAVVTDATGATVGVDVAAVLADTGTDGVVVASINNNAITTNSIASDAITAAKIASNAIDADALASDAVTEIQSGLATSSALSSLDTKIGTPAGASVSADIADVEGKVDDLESRVGTPSNLGSGATVAANLVDIESQTDDIGTAGAGLTAVPWNSAWDVEVESEVADALEATIADSIPADGSRPSTKQALLLITRFLMERSVSGTTLTVKKEDGSTTSMTFTLSDATSPTSITRST